VKADMEEACRRRIFLPPPDRYLLDAHTRKLGAHTSSPPSEMMAESAQTF